MKKIILLFLCCVTAFSFFGCQRKQENNYCLINGVKLNFISSKEKEELRIPLEKLIMEALALEPVTDSFFDSVKVFSADSPTIIPGIRYGLLDVNFDAVPELIVEPYGYTGSSGTATYSVFDVKSGKNVGVIHSGQDDWCVYLDITTNSLVTMGDYMTRCGWSEQSYNCDIIEFDEKQGVCLTRSLMGSYHSFIGSADDLYVNEQWSSVYYINGERSGVESYLFNAQEMRENYIRIPETMLILILDDHYYDLDISAEEHAKYIVDELFSTEQKFISK